MTNFLGIKQSFLSDYLAAKENGTHLGYLWLITNSKEDGGSYDIYFGSRKYSENGVVFNNLRTSFEGFLDSDGGFVLPTNKDFTSFEESGVTNFSDILYALDAAIKENKVKLSNRYTKTEVDNLISGVNTTITSYVKDVKVKLSDDNTETLTHDDDGSVTIDLTSFATKSELEDAGKVKDVQVNGNSIVDEFTKIANIDLDSKANVNDVYTKSQADDKFLTGVTIPEYEIKKQDTPEEGYAATYYLAKDGVQTGFKINTTLDQVLKNSSILTVTEADKPYTGAVVGDKYVRFEFQNNNEPQYLPVKDLVDVYTGSNSIEVSENNVISVKEVDASLTKLSTTIEVNGGPLANDVEDNWPWMDGTKRIIPSGKTMEEILTKLFLKVIDGTVKWGNASWSPSLKNPTITLSSNGPVEVGSKVKVSTLTAGDATAGSRSATCTCTQGYFLADADGNPTDEHNSGNKTISVAASITGTPVLTCTWNEKPVDISVNTTELVVEEGKNTISVSQSGQSATCDALPTTKVFAATNTKSLLSGVSASFSEDKPSDIPLTSSNNDTINAYYPIYTNGVKSSNGTASSETTLVANDGTKLPLVANNTTFYVNFAPMIDGGTGYRLLVKKDKKITEAMALNTLNSKYEVDMKSSFVKASTTVNKASGDSDIEYDVYEAKGSAGANAISFKID